MNSASENSGVNGSPAPVPAASRIERLGIAARVWPGLAFLLSSVLVYGLALKLHRVALYPGKLKWLTRLAVLAPDLAFATGFAAIAIAFAALCSRAWPRASLLLLQVSALCVVVLQTLSHGYFLASRQTLDYGMLAFALGRAGETAAVVASEAHWPLMLAFGGACSALLITPWWHWRARRNAYVGGALEPRRARGAAWITASAALLVAAASWPATRYAPPRVDRSFARDPLTYLASGAAAALWPSNEYRGTFTRLRKTGAQALVARDPAVRGKNLVVILLESTRADATTPYENTLKTTPFLQRFSKESVLVERAYAVVPHTSKALVAIFCGFEPEVNLNLIEAERDGLPGACLPALLQRVGYDTAFFQAPTGRFEQRSTLVSNLGFRHFRSGDDAPRKGLQKVNYFGYEDAVMLAPSKTWLSRRRERPFFAAYLTTASHHPYGVPTHHKHEKLSTHPAKNKYLNAVKHVDGVVQRIIEQYKSAGLYDDTVFLIVGDHGEAFGEHGLFVHDDVMYEEVLRVPLLMRLPGAQRAGQRVSGPVSELSIAPTLIDALGFEVQGGGYEGASWFERPREPMLFASCYRGSHCAALIRDPHKLIYFFDERPAELYDLRADPQEQHDLADRLDDLAERYSREILDLRLSIHETYKGASARALREYVTRHEPKVPHRLSAKFGDYLELLGYSLPSASVLRDFGALPINRFPMSYYFRVARPVPQGYELRVQLRGERQTVTVDHVPVRGLYALSDWKAGEYIDDVHRLVLPDRWQSAHITPCLMLVNDRGIPVTATRAGSAPQSCVPITTIPVQKKRR